MALITRAGRLLLSGGALTNDQGCCCASGGSGGGNGNPCTVNGEVCSCEFPLVSRSENGPVLTGCIGFNSWRRSQTWWGTSASFSTNNGWEWKEGYPQKLQGCRYQWLQDLREIRCCYAPNPFNFNLQTACQFVYTKYTLYAINCESREIVDITSEAVTKTPEFTPNTGNLSDPSLCTSCGDAPGFFPPPVIEPRCKCSFLGCTAEKYTGAIVTLNNQLLVNHNPANPYKTGCPPYYEEWQRLYAEKLNGTFFLNRTSLFLSPTKDSSSATFQYNESGVGVDCFGRAIESLGITVSISSGDNFFQPCNRTAMSVNAGFSVAASGENCQILFDINGGPRYSTIPGGCFLNSTDCPQQPGYQRSAFSAANPFTQETPRPDFCLGAQDFVFEKISPVFGSDIRGCDEYQVKTTWHVTLLA